MQRTCQTVKPSRKRQVRIAECRSDQVDGVGRNITTFVIAMDGEVKSHQLDEFGVVKAQHLSEIVAPVFGGVDRAYSRPVLERVAIDGRCYYWEFRDQVQAVFIDIL